MSVNASNLHPKYQTLIQSDLHRESIKALLSDKNFVKSGLVVSPGTGLSVNITAGSCVVGGVYITFNASTLSVPASSTVNIVVELQVDANNKPTGAVIKHVTTTPFPYELQLWLATVTTSSTSVTSVADRRVFRTRGFKDLITSSATQYWYNAWIFAVFAGGGGGGSTSTTNYTRGGQGGMVVVNNYFHKGGYVTFTVGAGGGTGTYGQVGGGSSITISDETESASGGVGGAFESSSSGLYGASSMLRVYGYPGFGVSATNYSSHIFPTIPSIFTASIQYGLIGNINPGVYSMAEGIIGSVPGNAVGSSVYQNKVFYGALVLSQGGNSGPSPTAGTAGKFLVHIWEV